MLIYTWLTVLFLSCLNHVWAGSNINIVNSNITIRAALYEIEKQTGYSVGFDETDLNVNKKLSLVVRDLSLEDALNQILKDEKCTYSIKDKHIIITKNKENSENNLQQDIIIQGKIVNDIGEALFGVSIVVEGTTNGTMTDVNEAFTIHVKDEKSVLAISYVGYNSQRITVGKNTYIQVSLKEDNKLLEEIVVIGYNRVRKKDLTTAVAVVSTGDINERPIISAAQALQGRAAGVQVVQPSRQPGSDLSIRIRGATSIQASNEPLYVVDGLPTTTISNLSANDIESMQVLKDASSAAIYGARAANGVVLITTKRGKAGVHTVSFSAYVVLAFQLPEW
ncbi:MAG: TonB-dependent receptor plug domain-containing protein [Tannerellaceae bacterium]|jgi:TonB-dependent SusC/RagA subfamily outer membrane receptor|nr:TonB-dependent receptor plug domain-containing protein [Tannerellaceae bacterium]